MQNSHPQMPVGAGTSYCQGETLFQVFLNLTKAYNTLDRECTLLIMEQYRVGPNVRRLLHTFWYGLQLCPRQGGYY